MRVTVLRETITSVIKPTAANDARPAKEKAAAALASPRVVAEQPMRPSPLRRRAERSLASGQAAFSCASAYS